MRVLVVDRSPPTSETQGNSLIGRQIFPRLARRHELVLVTAAPAVIGVEDERALRATFDDVYLVPVRKPVAALRGFMEGITGRGDAPAIAGALRIASDSGPFDVAHVRQLPMAAYARHLPAGPRLLELIDAETLQTRRLIDPRRPRTRVRHALARRVERLATRPFGMVTTIAEADAAVIRKLAPHATVAVVPNGVDADWFRPLPIDEEPNLVVFHGAMSFAPNESAAAWMVDQVMPILRHAVPGVRLALAGRDPSARVAGLADGSSVIVTGEVPDIRAWLARASVVVCPMRSGSGMKNKVLEGLAMARPMVSTSLGVEGLEVVAGRHLEVEDGPQAFAARVAELLADADRRRELGASGRAAVQERYTWDACAARYDDLYHSLMNGSPS